MPRPDTRRFAHPFRISRVLNMTNFLQVNWYPPFKKHGQEADTFSRDPICVYRPCLKTSESNTWGVLERVSLGGPSLPGTYDIGLTLTLIFLPPIFPVLGLCSRAWLCQLTLNPAFHFMLRTGLFGAADSRQVSLVLVD